MKIKLIFLLLVAGCATEPDTRICADYASHTFMREKCIPMYGALICADEEVTHVFCKRYEEEEKGEEEE